MSSTQTITELANSNWDNLSQAELKKQYENMLIRCEARKETCRKSSKQYYEKTYKLKNNPTADEVEKNKKVLSKRDNYQKDYYERNMEKIKEKQKKYRAARKLDKLNKQLTNTITIKNDGD